jgi:hypothetical protein
MNCATKIADALAPMREKRLHYESHPEHVKEILHDGETRGKQIAQQTMAEVHEVMKLG